MVAEIVVFVVAVYALVGAVFACAFVTVGVRRVDASAAGAPWLFRVLIWPGTAALWPVMLAIWLRAGRRGAAGAHS